MSGVTATIPAATAKPETYSGLRIRGLGAGYGAGLVLTDVDLDLPAGSITGVIGPNGSGKTTLLRAILGMAPTVIGSVILDGKPAAEERHRIAYVPQREAVDWSFPISAREVVMMGRYPSLGPLRRPGSADRMAVADAVARVDMTSYADRQIGALSGGQQQRIFLARALVQEASLLLLDEPMTGVDHATGHAIDGVLHELRDRGATIILTTHDLESAAEQSDLLALVNHRVVAFGPPESTFTPEMLHATFGGELIILGSGERRHVHAGGHHGAHSTGDGDR